MEVQSRFKRVSFQVRHHFERELYVVHRTCRIAFISFEESFLFPDSGLIPSSSTLEKGNRSDVVNYPTLNSFEDEKSNFLRSGSECRAGDCESLALCLSLQRRVITEL